MFQDINVEQLLNLQKNKTVTLIDVRSPSEFRDSAIPGSLNIPLFNDSERAEIGTIYNQVGIHAAKEKGLKIVSAKLPAFVKTFQSIQEEKVVYCWRGGMRSKTTATVLSLMDIHVYRLTGGIRDFRKWVVQTLEQYNLTSRAVVLNGYTGTGKTTILQMLKERGHAVLDLEQMAGHRGSVFGGVGCHPHNQKQFDYLLFHELQRVINAPYVVFEGESKRIGKVVLPEFLVKKKEQATQIVIELPLDERVRNIVADYEPWKHHEQIIHAFSRIKKQIHTPVAKEIEACLKNEQYEPAVERLLQYYYDPKYKFALTQYNEEPIVIKANRIEEAAAAIEDFLINLKANFEQPTTHG